MPPDATKTIEDIIESAKTELLSHGFAGASLRTIASGANITTGALYRHFKDKDELFKAVVSPVVEDLLELYDAQTKVEFTQLNEVGLSKMWENTENEMTMLVDYIYKHFDIFTYNSIQLLLNNRRYIGEFCYRDVIIPDGILAIVPQDLFDRVQEKMAKNKKAPARHKAEDDYLLTTKLFCGHCGAYLCGESGTSRTKKVHHYYKCVNAKKKKTCNKKPVKKDWIENLVIDETMKIVMDDKAIEAIVSMVMDLQEQESTSLPLYEQQLQEANIGIQNLLNAIQQGILTTSSKTRLEELEANKEDLEIKIASENLIRPKVDAEFVTFWLHRFRKLDVRQQSHRKMLIDTFINAIYLYDDKIIITFNYKDGTKTITFEDIKGSDLDCTGAPKSFLWGLQSISAETIFYYKIFANSYGIICHNTRNKQSAHTRFQHRCNCHISVFSIL